MIFQILKINSQNPRNAASGSLRQKTLMIQKIFKIYCLYFWLRGWNEYQFAERLSKSLKNGVLK